MERSEIEAWRHQVTPVKDTGSYVQMLDAAGWPVTDPTDCGCGWGGLCAVRALIGFLCGEPVEIIGGFDSTRANDSCFRSLDR